MMTDSQMHTQTMWNPPSGFVSGMDGDRAGHFNCDYRQVPPFPAPPPGSSSSLRIQTTPISCDGSTDGHVCCRLKRSALLGSRSNGPLCFHVNAIKGIFSFDVIAKQEESR